MFVYADGTIDKPAETLEGVPVFFDRPHWKSSISDHPILIRVGMHLRHRHFLGCWYQVYRLNLRARLVELMPADGPLLEVSFEEVEQDYQPTMLLGGPVKAPPSPRILYFETPA